MPRRHNLSYLTPPEKAIADAMCAVEKSGADPLLTDAITLLEQAKNKVADYMDTRLKAELKE